MTRLLSMALASACVSACAHAATLIATPANIVAQITAAKPGDTVQLGAGSYGQVNAWNIKQAAPGVTVSPAPGATPTFTGINVNGSTWLTLDGLTIKGPGVVAQGTGTANLTFKNMDIEAADQTTFPGVAFAIRLANNITISNNTMAWQGTAVSVLDSDHVTVVSNTIHDVAIDGVDMAGTTNSTVKGNTATNFHPPSGAHPDFIQFWSTATTLTSNLDIEGNRFDRGTGAVAQGIFGEDGANATISGNVLLGTMYNGIGLARTKTATISGNYLQGYPDMSTQIIVRGGCDKVTISGNAAQAISNYVVSTEAPCTNVTISGNTTVQPAAMGDNTQVNAWVAAKGVSVTSPPPATNPLQSVVDSLNAAIAKLQAQVATDQVTTTAQASANTALQAQLTQAQAALMAAQGQLAADAKAFAAIKAAIPGS